MDWVRIPAYVTGMVDQELLTRNEYLAAENRILKAQLKGLAIEEGLEVGDYAANLDLDNSAVAIDVLALGPVLRGWPGLDLIQTTPSSDKLRKHQVRLTPKGRKLIGEMLRHLRENPSVLRQLVSSAKS